MWKLTNTVRHYPWGSRTVIPDLLGLPSPTEEPCAELWLGAHPDDPSVLSSGVALDKAIAAEPEAMLGAAVAQRFGARLPFLMKVLAADANLSLQAHPTRTFKDPYHKPEMIVAVTTLEALCGFRPVEESLHCLAKLQLPELKPTIAALARGGLRAAIPQLLALSEKRRTSLVDAVA